VVAVKVHVGPRRRTTREEGLNRSKRIISLAASVAELGVCSRLMARGDLYRSVDDLPDDTVDDTALVLKMIMRRQLDPAQTWVWTEQWQEQLRGSFGDLEAGRSQHFDTGEDLLAAL